MPYVLRRSLCLSPYALAEAGISTSTAHRDQPSRNQALVAQPWRLVVDHGDHGRSAGRSPSA
jgi:hypothetical protein